MASSSRTHYHPKSLRGGRENPPPRDDKSRSLDVISSKFGKEIATTYFSKSGRVAKLGRTIALRDLKWIEASNMVNLAVCNRVLEAHKLKGTKNIDKEVEPQPRDWENILKAAESTKETSEKLIRDLSLRGVKVRIGKDGIVETDNKDPAPSANPPTPTLEDQGSLPILTRAPYALALTMLPSSSLEPEAHEPDSSTQYKASSQHKATEPDHSPHHEAAQPMSSPKHEVARPDSLLQHEVTKPDPPLQQEATKPDRSSQQEADGIVFSTQYDVDEAGSSLQHKGTEPHPLQEYEAAAPDLSRPEEATQPDISLQHGVAQPDSSTPSAQHEANEPNHSPEQEASQLDHSIQHEVAAPDPLDPLCKYEMFDISTGSPAKRRAMMGLVKTPAKANRSSVFDHAIHCDSGTADCSCCTTLGDLNSSWHEQLQSSGPESLLEGICLLSALRFRRGHTDLCWLHFKALVTKLGLKSNEPGKSLIERIDAIWGARGSWEELSRLKNTFPLWFIGAECTAQDHKVEIGKGIPTFASVSDYGEEDSAKMTTSTACVSCSKEEIENMKIYDAMTKLGDEEVSHVAHLDKGQIGEFRKRIIAGDEIAKSIGQLRLLHPESRGKNSKIIYVHEYSQQSPHGFKVVLDLHNLLPFCKDEWLTAQAINGTLAELANPLDPAIQLLSAEVGYLIFSKADGPDKRPIQGHDIPNIKPSTTTIIMPWNIHNLHWIVAKVTCSNNQGIITVYDSLNKSSKKMTSKKIFAIVMKEITKHIQFSPWHESSWSEKHVRFSSECAAQKGSSDCGVHTIYNALILAKGREPTNQPLDCAARRKEYFEAYCRFFSV